MRSFLSTAALAMAAFVSTPVTAFPFAASAAETVSGPTALVRVVHGSPDAGPVSVEVNGATVLNNFLYGTITPYIPLAPGTYKISVVTAGGAAVNITATVKANVQYSLVATGEIAPAAHPATPNITVTAYVDGEFTAGKPAINFHHAAPVANVDVPFGIASLADPVPVKLGASTFGNDTGPLDLPKKFFWLPIEAYAVSVKNFTLIPNQVNPADFLNVLPSRAGANLSVFAVDGPAAAAKPTISGTDAVRLIGIFDK
jgi:hypothetical protein